MTSRWQRQSKTCDLSAPAISISNVFQLVVCVYRGIHELIEWISILFLSPRMTFPYKTDPKPVPVFKISMDIGCFHAFT